MLAARSKKSFILGKNDLWSTDKHFREQFTENNISNPHLAMRYEENNIGNKHF
jgi:hypothetical protein